MKYQFQPSGVCAKSMELDIEDGKIKDIKIIGGCRGNTRGIELLCIGRDAKEVMNLLNGVECGTKGTSCPDQLSKALKQALSC